MKKPLLYLLVFVSLFIMESCSSGKQAYERGDYYASVMKSVQRLRKNPDHKKSSETLRSSYPLAVEDLLNSINGQINSNSIFKWKNAVEGYKKLNTMYEEILRAPGAKRVVQSPRSFYNELADVKQKAAEESYQVGIAYLMKGTREDAKRAFYTFSEVNQYVPDYKEVGDMIEKSRDAATLKVVIDQIPVPGRYSLSGDFFQDKIESYLRNYENSNQFVRFYTPTQSRNLTSYQQIIKIQFDDYTVGNEYVTKSTTQYEKDSVVVGDFTDSEGVKHDVYGTVKAKLTVYKKEVKSSGLLSMKVFDAQSDAILKHEKIEGNYVWGTSWGNYNGDSRALSKSQLALCEKKEGNPPNDQTMFKNFTTPIYNKLAPKMKSYFDRY